MITIDCAKSNDYPKFEGLQKRFKYLGTSELRREPSVTKETFDDYVARESMLVAYLGEELVGYAFLDAYLDDNDDVVCSIREIFVDPEHQRKGYGKEIVQRVINYIDITNEEKADNFPHWKTKNERHHARKKKGVKNGYEIISDEKERN